MLNNAIKDNSYENQLDCAECIINLFGDRNYEFKNVIECIYNFLTPFAHTFDESQILQIYKLTEFLLF